MLLPAPEEEANTDHLLPAPEEEANTDHLLPAPEEEANTDHLLPAPKEEANTDHLLPAPEEEANTDHRQGQEQPPQEQEPYREGKEFHSHPRDHTGIASRHQYSQTPSIWHETTDYCANNWSEGGDWNYGYSLYNWQY
ncbi:hypothetical protein ACOMHN_061761 [Nucella lapillus]